jgi:mannose-6-phosphate isomerase-like protein (cupin superfamily)
MIKTNRIYREERPWGGFTQFTHNEVSTVKILKVNPGERNSLQYHHHRQELWVPLDENSEVVVRDKKWRPKKFEEIFIDTKQKHRLIGAGKEPGYVLEISFGNFDEDDIVRVEDDYNRTDKK